MDRKSLTEFVVMNTRWVKLIGRSSWPVEGAKLLALFYIKNEK